MTQQELSKFHLHYNKVYLEDNLHLQDGGMAQGLISFTYHKVIAYWKPSSNLINLTPSWTIRYTLENEPYIAPNKTILLDISSLSIDELTSYVIESISSIELNKKELLLLKKLSSINEDFHE